MRAHIVCGMTGTGKSFYVKKMLRKIPEKKAIFIYDVNDEYREFFDYRILDFEDFAYKTTLLYDAVIVFEEATIFLDGRTNVDKSVKQLLALKRHRRNYIFLIFHSVAEIPPYVYRLCNYITLFKTNDLPDMSARELRDVRLKDFMLRIKAAKNPHYYETMKIL